MSEIGDFFNENGYYHAKKVFDAEQLVNMEKDYDRIVEQIIQGGADADARWKGKGVSALESGTTTRVMHTHNVQKFSSVWMKALLDDRLLDAAQAILGPDIILHHTKLFQKPAEEGAPFPMHQDWSYFPTEKDSMIAGIIHVSDATDEMGCLRVYPGSHKLGRVEHTSGQEDVSSILDDYPIEQAVPVECEAGDVVFFHYFTLHGSMPNRSTRTRKTVLLQLHAGDDKVEEQETGTPHAYASLALRGFNRRITRKEASRAE